MATDLHLRLTAAPDLSTDTDQMLGVTPSAVATIQNVLVTTVTGPAALQFGDTKFSWWFQVAAVTISGTISFSFTGDESGMAVNAGLRCVVDRCGSTGTFISNVITSDFGTELGTTFGANSWTGTPTSTTFVAGDYLRVRVYAVDAGGTMAAGSAVLRYDNSQADSIVTFTETIVAGSPTTGPVGRSQLISQAVQRAATR